MLSSEIIVCVDCTTGNTKELSFNKGKLIDVKPGKEAATDLPFIGPGLIELQVK